MSDIPVVSPARCMFVIYDRVAEAFIGQVIVEKHPAPACRLFSDLLADSKTFMHAHPTDYDLLQVAFIEEDGRVEAFSTPDVVMTGASWVATNSAES